MLIDRCLQELINLEVPSAPGNGSPIESGFRQFAWCKAKRLNLAWKHPIRRGRCLNFTSSQSGRSKDPKFVNIRYLHTPTVLANATNFGRMTEYAQTKNFKAWPHTTAWYSRTQVLKHLSFEEYQYLFTKNFTKLGNTMLSTVSKIPQNVRKPRSHFWITLLSPIQDTTRHWFKLFIQCL